jgi:hypothetical protein
MNARTLMLVVATALVAAPAAPAKGPISANVSGPGDGSGGSGIAIGGDGEGGNSTPLGRLVESAGFFPAAFGQVPDPMLQQRPKGRLGPRYTIRYRVPGPNNEDDTIVQDVYPYATPSAVTYTRPGQPFFGSEHTRGGWFVGGSELRSVLVAAGLPAKPSLTDGTPSAPPTPAPAPVSDDGFEVPVVVVSLAALAFFLGLALYAVIRRRPAPAPR